MADVIIVGAGPAGSVLATLLARRSITSLLLDKARFPRPKICGDYLSPGTVHLLSDLDLLDGVRDAGAQRIQGMEVIAPDGTAFTATYPPTAKTEGDRPHALSLPRAALDSALLEQAKCWGVKCLEAFRVTHLIQEEGRVRGVRGTGAHGPEEYRGGIVVGADGRNSVVARRLGLFRPHATLHRMALATLYEGPPPLRGRGQISIGPGSYCILNPIGASLVNACIVLDQPVVRAWTGRLEDLFGGALAAFPRARAALRGMRRAGPVRCLGPLAYRARRVARAGAILIGDAGGFYDPFTGEGVLHALRSAVRAARLIEETVTQGCPATPLLARFDRAQRRSMAARERLGAPLQAIVRRPALANALARFLAPRPRLADRLLGVVGDVLSPRDLLAIPTLRELLR